MVIFGLAASSGQKKTWEISVIGTRIFPNYCLLIRPENQKDISPIKKDFNAVG
jgi:hypothetical protein